MNDLGSFYSQFTGDVNSSSPVIVNTPEPAYEVSSTPFANRQDLAKPYTSSFNEKAADATTGTGYLTNANNEWMKLILNRGTPDDIAKIINLSFTRNDINGDNFQQNKTKFFRLYSEQERLIQ